jgi:hypothetical protein
LCAAKRNNRKVTEDTPLQQSEGKVHVLWTLPFFIASWAGFVFGIYAMEVYTTSFFESIKFFVFTHTITTLLAMTLKTAVLGLIVGLAQGVVLVICLPNFNFSRWLLYNLLGFGLGGIPGLFSFGAGTAVTATLAQYLSLKRYIPNANRWFTIMPSTTIPVTVLYNLNAIFSGFGGTSSTEISVLRFFGLLFAIGVTCAFYFSVRLPNKSTD